MNHRNLMEKNQQHEARLKTGSDAFSPLTDQSLLSSCGLTGFSLPLLSGLMEFSAGRARSGQIRRLPPLPDCQQKDAAQGWHDLPPRLLYPLRVLGEKRSPSSKRRLNSSSAAQHTLEATGFPHRQYANDEKAEARCECRLPSRESSAGGS